MKIGILTWFFADNYGARAQSFALQKTLEALGHNVEMINYVPFKNKILNLKMCLSHPGCKINPIKIVRDLIRHLFFQRDKSIYNISTAVRSAQSINELHYDFVILGSDAIFNLLHPMSDKLYYGVGINAKKATYSPSCEYMNTDYALSADEKDSLQTMGKISVRDNRTTQLLQQNGFTDIIETLDPTFLYDFKLFNQAFPEKDYILVYCFSDWAEYSKDIQQFAKEKKLKIISIGRICNWANKSYDTARLGEWISAFRAASIVVTDSYHGTIFAIKNHKQIILFSRQDKIDKINCLLSQFEIQLPVYQKNTGINNYIGKNSINYSVVEKNLKRLVTKSITYLKDKIT